VHFDQRPFYSQRAFAQRKQAGLRALPLSQLGSRAAFASGSREVIRQNYARARLAVESWLAQKGNGEARRFLDGLHCDEELARELDTILRLAP
jgi:hypothetical protein